MPSNDMPGRKKTVLFRRKYNKLRGGHIKVRDYLDHVRAHPDFEAKLWFTPGSKVDDPLWAGLEDVIVDDWRPEEADLLFFAGIDWRGLEPDQQMSPPCPVFNLVQHTRHADEGQERREFLRFPAFRVCCSKQVEDAIRGTGLVNGEVLTIPYGIEPELWDHAARARDVDVVVCGSKRPDMARKIGKKLEKAGHSVAVMDGIIPRVEFLGTLGRGRVAIFLPNDGEGFYLPALEAMAMGVLVVCPALGGLQSFLVDGENADTPPCDVAPLVEAARRALAFDDGQRQTRLEAADATARRHSPEAEREAFYAVLDRIVPRS